MFIILSIVQLWFVYLASTFIVFWERDITSEHHGTPVHISTIVYTFTLLSAFTFLLKSLLPFQHCVLILCKQQDRRDWQPLCTRWEQSYLLCVQVHVNLVSIRQQFLAPLTTTCISVSPTGSITSGSSLREFAAILHLKPFTWGNQRGARSHQLVPKLKGYVVYRSKFTSVKIPRFVSGGLTEIQEGVNGAEIVAGLDTRLTWTCTHNK